MAGVESAKKALWALLRSFNANRTAKLTVTTAKGKLKVIFEESFDQHCKVKSTAKSPRRVSPSQLRRKTRRAADPAVQQRAAEHQARVAAAATDEPALPSPEKERSDCAPDSLAITPVKEVVREEVGVEVIEEEVAKLPRVQVPHDWEDRANNGYEHDFERVKEAFKIMSENDQCGFCEFKCPTPTLKESEDRYPCGPNDFGILDSLWDHIEECHPLAYEWLG